MRANLPSQRRDKDKLFVRLFSEPETALSLFNALNGTSYHNADELQIITLEDAVADFCIAHNFLKDFFLNIRGRR